MNPSELFKKALKEILWDSPRGTQSKLADDSGVGRKHLSDYLGGRAPLSETKRALIAEALGISYEELLARGRRIIEGTEQPPPIEQPSNLRRISDRTDEGNTREGIISLFQDRESAREMILHLVEIEKADREQFVDIRGYIRGVFKSFDIKKEA